MRLFFFVLLFCGKIPVAAAQAVEPDIKKLIEKNQLSLLKLQAPGLVPQIPHTVTKQQTSLPGTMPCVVPDTSGLAAMPNALPERNVPAVAAIPNPGLKQGMTFLKSLPLSNPK